MSRGIFGENCVRMAKGRLWSQGKMRQSVRMCVAGRLMCGRKNTQYKGVCVRVGGRGATAVWKEKTHNIGGGGGVCVRV